MSDPVVRLRFPAKAEYLVLARLALAGIARKVPMGEEVLADLKLAVTEACGNAVRHAYQEGEGNVTVSFLVDSDRLDVIVEDEGAGLSLAIPAPAREPHEGGMGMAIIRAVVDGLEVRDGTGGRGTTVHMTKLLGQA